MQSGLLLWRLFTTNTIVHSKVQSLLMFLSQNFKNANRLLDDIGFLRQKLGYIKFKSLTLARNTLSSWQKTRVHVEISGSIMVLVLTQLQLVDLRLKILMSTFQMHIHSSYIDEHMRLQCLHCRLKTSLLIQKYCLP